MKTKNIFKALAFALLITTACNRIEVSVKKGYELPVIINATRQGDNPATRATYNGSTKKLEFSSGDKLRVRGYNATVGEFGGILDWYSGGTFKGTILTENEYTGTVEDLFTATPEVYACLLPAGYGTYGFISVVEKNGYDNMIQLYEAQAFALTKATAIEQFSWERGNYVPSNGFVLSPQYAILNFTINGLTASTEYAVVVSDGSYDRGGNVTTNGSGTATFAVGVSGGTESEDITLTVGGTPITLNLFGGTNTELVAGHIYNINRSALPTLNLTSPTVGQVIGGDGINYAANASLPDGVNKIAVIVYMNENNGLALTLHNAGVMNWGDANTYATNATPKFSNATWRIPTNDDWWKIFGQTGSANPNISSFDSGVLPGYIINAGGNNFVANQVYRSGSEQDSDNAWTMFVNFANQNGVVAHFVSASKVNGGIVRLCLAF